MKPRKDVQVIRELRAGGWRCPMGLPIFLVLLVPLAVAPPAGAEDPPAVCVAVDVSADVQSTVIFIDGFEAGDTTPWQDGTPAFSATEILDVMFEVGVVGEFVGDSLLEMNVYTPNGHLYQVLTAPVTSQSTKAARERRVAGFPYPLRVQHLRSATAEKSSSPGAVLTFSVGGTLIVSNSLYGLWEVKPHLGGEPASCGAPIRFNLIQ